MLTHGEKLRAKLDRGHICLGTWTASCDPCIAELLCGAGFDFLMIDWEHGALNIETVQRNVMATKNTGVAAIVRVPWNDPVLIKPVLDAGAAGILVPMVKTPEEARRAVAACMYPPAGVRGFGPRRPSDYERDAARYIARANETIAVWAQIEHIEAVRNVRKIVRTAGLSGVFIGSNDLSASLGLLGQPEHPRVLKAIDAVIEAGKDAGMPVGIGTSLDPRSAHAWLRKGMQFVTLGSVSSILTGAADAAVSALRELVAPAAGTSGQ